MFFISKADKMAGIKWKDIKKEEDRERGREREIDRERKRKRERGGVRERGMKGKRIKREE